jgi:subtilisin family serine protease
MKLNRFGTARAIERSVLSVGFAALLAGAALPSYAQPAVPPGKAKRAAAGELIVKFRSDVTDAEIENVVRDGKLKVRKHLRTGPMAERNQPGLTLAETELDAATALARLKNHRAVEYVEENQVYQHQAVSNDPYVTANYTWGLYGDLSSPANAFGSQAAEAWASGYVGTNSVVVAVIDEGIDISHADLAPNIWTNPFDPVDGLDNDGNGYIDDTHGWDFYSEQNNVFDAAGDAHGTHVAGTIGAKGGNGGGVAGVNWDITIISGKFLGADGGTTFDAVEAIDYFVDLKQRHKVNLVAINASWGGGGYSQALHDATIRAAKAGILFIAAAGNEGLNNDISASYPANLDTRVGTSTESAASYDAVISVAAIDSTGALASFSNYGATKVDLAAPGVDILSTYPGNYLAYMDGTSMATPHVTGAVALYCSTHPGASAASVRQAILGSVIATPSVAGKSATGGRLNLSSIVTPAPALPAAPVAPTGVSATATTANVAGSSTITVRWNASSGATSYKVKRSTSASGPWTVVASGVTGSSYSQSLSANGATYYYRVTATNTGGDSADSGNASVSPVPPSPAALTASALSSSQVRLSWLDRSSDEQGFKVEYWNGSAYVQIGTLPAGSTTATITGTASRRTYYFRVRAYSGTSNTAYSNTASVTTP